MAIVSSLAELHPDQVHSRAGQNCKGKVEPSSLAKASGVPSEGSVQHFF